MPFRIITTVKPTNNTLTTDSFLAVSISPKRHYRLGMKRGAGGVWRTFLFESSWPKIVQDKVSRHQADYTAKGRPVGTSDFIVYLSQSSEPVHEGQNGLHFDINFIEESGRLNLLERVWLNGTIVEFRTG